MALVGFSRTASAHGDGGQGGTPVTFAVVVGLPVVVGLVAGLAAIAARKRTDGNRTGRGSTVVLGALFLLLGGTFAVEAVTRSTWATLAGGVGGVVGLYVVTRGDESGRGDVCHAELPCAAISLHRGLEGLAIGTLYSAGAVVGVFGAVAIAGHTVLETGAVGGQYRSYRLEAIAAIGVVQLGYAGGAIAGAGLAATIPVPVRSASLALVGGLLVAIGAHETRRSEVVRRVASRT